MKLRMIPAEPDEFAIYKPSAFYFRQALRRSKDPKDLRHLGMTVVSELEALKAWVREQGMIPPRWNVTLAEAEDKRLETESETA